MDLWFLIYAGLEKDGGFRCVVSGGSRVSKIIKFHKTYQARAGYVLNKTVCVDFKGGYVIKC